MKKFLVLLLLLITVVLIAPKFIGSIVEAEHQSALAKLNENPAITINSTQYTRHWFTGTATTEMTILVESEQITDIKLIIEESQLFGPIIFTDEGLKFGLSYSLANINFKDFALDEEVETFIQDTVHLSALLTFSKNIVSHLIIDEVSKEIDGKKIVSAKALGKFTFDNNHGFYGDFAWAGLSLLSNKESFIIDNLVFSVDQTLVAGDFFQGNAISIGDFEFTIGSILGKDTAGQTVLSVDKLSAKATSSVNNDLMNITMAYHVDKAVSAEQQFEDANLVIVFDKFNIHVMQDVNTLMSTLSADSDAMFNQENLKNMSELTAKLLVHEPVIEIKDFSVQTPEGLIESSMQVNVDKNLFDSSNLMSIMAAVKANANGKAPRDFFEKLELSPLIDMYVEQGLIISKENELSFKLNYSQGKLAVNGKVISI